jgi:hypothetical protein
VRRYLEPSHSIPRLLRLSPVIYPQQPTFICYLRKLVPSSFRRNPVRPVNNDEPRDPLDVCLFVSSPPRSARMIDLQVPVPLRLPHNPSPAAEAVAQVHSGMNSDENVSVIPVVGVVHLHFISLGELQHRPPPNRL